MMSVSARLMEVMKQVDSLPTDEKMQLLDHIISESAMTKLPDSWETELARREELARQGKMEYHDFDSVVRELEERYGQKD